MDFYDFENDYYKDEEEDIIIEEKIDNKKKLNKYEREIKYKNKLIKNSKLYHGAYYKDEKYIHGKGFIKIEKPYYKRFYRSHKSKNRYKFCKIISNRKVRNYNKGISNGNGYKKIFDYWWEVD